MEGAWGQDHGRSCWCCVAITSVSHTFLHDHSKIPWAMLVSWTQKKGLREEEEEYDREEEYASGFDLAHLLLCLMPNSDGCDLYR